MVKCAVIAALALTFSAAPCDAALIHLYQFSTDGQADDQVGSADGTLVGGATVAGGQLILDGDNDYVDFFSSIIPTSGDFTVSLRARQLGLPSPPDYVEFISQGQAGTAFYIGFNHPGTGNTNIRAGDTWSIAEGSTGEPSPTDGLYHMYTVTRDSGLNVTRLYLDGVLEQTFGSAIASPAGGTGTRLGRQYGSLFEYFEGNLDDVAIYSHALTGEEVGQLASPVPEPSTLLLGVSGLGALLYVSRRRHRRRAARALTAAS